MAITNFKQNIFIISKAYGVDFRANNIESIENLKKFLDFYASVKSLLSR